MVIAPIPFEMILTLDGHFPKKLKDMIVIQ